MSRVRALLRPHTLVEINYFTIFDSRRAVDNCWESMYSRCTFKCLGPIPRNMGGSRWGIGGLNPYEKSQVVICFLSPWVHLLLEEYVETKVFKTTDRIFWIRI